MIETLTIINTAALITMFMIYPLVRKQRGASTFTHPRAGDKLSMLNRRREALRLATKEWHGELDRGYTSLAKNSKRLVDQLEREVAALETELFNPKAEGIIKPETPKNEPVAVIRCGCHEPCKVLYYKTQCSFCEWSGSSFSKETAEARRVKHEMRHA